MSTTDRIDDYPPGWTQEPLESVAEIRTGLAKSAERASIGDIELPYLRVANVQDGHLDLTVVKTISVSPNARERYSLFKGDVLFTEGGDFDKLGRGAVWRGEISSCLHQNHVFVVRPETTRLLPSFLAYFAAGPIGKAYFMASAKRTTNLASINSSQLRVFPIPVPPISEQKKISAILSSVDNAIEGTQAVIDQLQVVKKAMMADLLTRGIPGRHKKFKMTEIGEVPEEWEVVRAGDLCGAITKGTTPAQQNRGAGDIPFLKVYNIDPRGFVDFTYQPTFIPTDVHSGELRRSKVFPGDVLMNIVGPPLGKVAVVPSDFPEANINQAIAVFRPTRVESEFLANCLAEAGLFAWAASRAKRTSTQLNLTLEICRDYPMPFPPEMERSEICALLRACNARIDAEICAVEGLRNVKSALMSVLLTGKVRVRVDDEATA